MTTEFDSTDEHALWVEEAAAKLPSNVREALKACACAHAAFEDVLQPFIATRNTVFGSAHPTKSLSDSIELLEALDAETIKARYIADLKAYRAYSATFDQRDRAGEAYYIARKNATKALIDFFLAPAPEEP